MASQLQAKYKDCLPVHRPGGVSDENWRLFQQHVNVGISMRRLAVVAGRSEGAIANRLWAVELQLGLPARLRAIPRRVLNSIAESLRPEGGSWEAVYVELVLATDDDLLALPGIGIGSVRALRAVIPYAGTDRRYDLEPAPL